MESKFSWSLVARQGAVLGSLLAASAIFEMEALLSGRLGWMFLVLVEYVTVVVLHYYLLHRYTKQYGSGFSTEEGFSFGQGYSYLLSVSAFAGMVVGAAQALYMHAVVGYAAYIDRYVAMMKGVMAQMGTTTPQVATMMRQTIEALQQAEAPSIFSTAFSGAWNVLLFGMLFGLIIAGVLARSPKISEKQDE